MRRIIIPIILVFILTAAEALSALPAQAQFTRSFEETQERARGDVEAELGESKKTIECRQGFLDFLSALVGYSDFTEYWTDLFRVNACHRTDIEAVERQLIRARREVKATFLRCETERLERFAPRYYKLETELAFLRKGFDENIKSEVKYLLRDDDGNRTRKWNELLNDLAGKFERGYKPRHTPTKNDIDGYLQEFEAKYRARYDGIDSTYNNCRSEMWEEIGAKLQELIENFQHAGEVFAEAGEDIEREAVAFGQETGRAFTSQEKGTSPRSGNVLDTEEGLELNLRFLKLKVPSPASLVELLEPKFKEFGKKISQGFGQEKEIQGPVRHGDVRKRIAEEEERFSKETSLAEMRAKFNVLYGASDSGTLEFREKLDELMNSFKGLPDSSAHPGSIQNLSQIAECAYQVKSKQCKNKQ